MLLFQLQALEFVAWHYHLPWWHLGKFFNFSKCLLSLCETRVTWQEMNNVRCLALCLTHSRNNWGNQLHSSFRASLSLLTFVSTAYIPLLNITLSYLCWLWGMLVQSVLFSYFRFQASFRVWMEWPLSVKGLGAPRAKYEQCLSCICIVFVISVILAPTWEGSSFLQT